MITDTFKAIAPVKPPRFILREKGSPLFGQVARALMYSVVGTLLFSLVLEFLVLVS